MRRRIERRAGLPGTRAVVGALLMAVAAIGVLLAHADAGDGPADDVVVANGDIRAGERVTAADLRVEAADLPGRGRTFAAVDALVGRVAVAPIGEGEIVQASAVTDDRAAAAAHEIALTLPRQQVAVGRLKSGERVDVFSTSEERTVSVVRGAVVVQIGVERDGSLTSEREVSVVVAVESGDQVAALVHALRTGDVTVVRSTLVDDAASEPLTFEAGDATAPTANGGDG
ncbi:MAG: SAF domain-containing protein [Acidimicrobiales bacterium]